MEEDNRREYCSHFHIWKWVIGIFIIFAAFGVGFFCGRFSVFFGGYGYPMGPWMMYGYPYGYGDLPSQVSTNTTTSVPYYYPMWRMMGGYYPQL